MGAIGTPGLRRSKGRQPVAAQHPLNRAQAGGCPVVAFAPLTVDGTCAHWRKPQARLGALHQLLAQAYNAPLTADGRSIGMRVRRTGRRAKAGPGVVRTIADPLVHPATAA